MDSDIVGADARIDPIFHNLINEHPPILCRMCRRSHDYTSFLKVLKDGSMKQLKSCQQCRERTASTRRQPLGELNPNRQLAPRDGRIPPPDPMPGRAPPPTPGPMPGRALPPTPGPMPGRAPPPTPDPVPSVPVNRLPLRRARVDSFSDNEDIQPQPPPPDSVEEQLPMVAAGNRRGRRPRIARVREVPPAWMDVYDSNSPPNHYLGPMDKICEFCGALHFEAEAIRARIGVSTRMSYGSKCCANGDVDLTLPKSPDLLMKLWTLQDPRAKEFRKYSRRYNNALAFTSFKYDEDQRLQRSGNNWSVFTIHGRCYHYQGPVAEQPGEKPAFNQLFLHDPEYAADVRMDMEMCRDLNRTTMVQIDMLIRDCNPYVAVYKHAKEMVAQQRRQDNDEFRIVINPKLQLIVEKQNGEHQGRHNLPTAPEIALIIPDEVDDGRLKGPRDIVLGVRRFNEEGEEIPSNYLRTIHVSHPSYIPLHYVTLFPFGESGWNFSLKLKSTANPDRTRMNMSQQQWYRWMTFIRHGINIDNDEYTVTDNQLFNPLFHAGSLFQQFMVDSYASIEETRLAFLRKNQDKLRSDVYCGLADALRGGDADVASIGKQIILPSSHLGGERFMQQAYQDAMAVVRKAGKPSFFITFTCNTNWSEIKEQLLPGQTATDRPDIVARVFWLKVKALIKDLKGGLFGEYISHTMTIEYQKRGLPHMHLLLNVRRTDNPYDRPELVDKVILAELPSAELDPTGELTTLVKKHMIHGPCGEHNPRAPCMFARDGAAAPTCSKKFPKAFQESTFIPENGDAYPQYRRQAGPSWKIRKPQTITNEEIEMNNSWVVPYNPYLLMKYKAHINVEVCATVNAIKYIHKYTFKGTDRATLDVDDPRANDEIHQHLSGRYIGAIEAYWRLIECDTHQCYPPVTRLAVHIEGQQTVYFGDLTPDELRQRMDASRTTLLGWFKYNKDHLHRKGLTHVVNGVEERVHDDLSGVLYPDFPEYATWDSSNKVWKTRKMKKNVLLADQSPKAIGRMYNANMLSGERYYLRCLLTIIPGATCYKDLRMHEGVEYPTFRESCVAHGIAENDREWENAFNEAKDFQSAGQLREMFIMALKNKLIVDPLDIWTKFKAEFADASLTRDMVRRQIYFPLDLVHPTEDYALYLIQVGIGEDNSNMTLRDNNLPSPLHNWANHVVPSDVYIPEEELQKFNELFPTLNLDQRRLFDIITAAILDDPTQAHFYLQGPGGCGKTYLYIVLCHHYRSQGKIVLCVASTGIAALLLPGGTTSHSRFGIPINLEAHTTSNIKVQNKEAELLRKCSLIIWDEVIMQNRLCFELVHKLFCDLAHLPWQDPNTPLMGGKSLILSGDFAQTLPIVPKGSKYDIIKASIRSSWMWPSIQRVNLTRNMRLVNVSQDQWLERTVQFKDWISKIAYDPVNIGSKHLPDFIQKPHTLEVLIDKIYPRNILISGLHSRGNSPYIDRCIVTTKNVTAAEINKAITDQMPGECITLLSHDTQDDAQEADVASGWRQPMENLQAIDLPSLPPAKLKLKVGMPVMCLRNIRPSQGLCNGSRMIITDIKRHVLEVMLLGGEFHGAMRHIPRIIFKTQEGELPFILKRKQFPIKPCFAMTINKSQGQGFVHIGVDLRSPCFSHGQFYVAMTRSKDLRHLYVLLPLDNDSQPGRTANIVWSEVLQDIND